MLSTCLSRISVSILSFFFFNDTATTEIYTLSLHDALPISPSAAPRQGPGDPDGHRRRAEPRGVGRRHARRRRAARPAGPRSEEHTSELQSPCNLVCRLLLEKKKNRDPVGLASCTPGSINSG